MEDTSAKGAPAWAKFAMTGVPQLFSAILWSLAEPIVGEVTRYNIVGLNKIASNRVAERNR